MKSGKRQEWTLHEFHSSSFFWQLSSSCTWQNQKQQWKSVNKSTKKHAKTKIGVDSRIDQKKSPTIDRKGLRVDTCGPVGRHPDGIHENSSDFHISQRSVKTLVRSHRTGFGGFC